MTDSSARIAPFHPIPCQGANAVHGLDAEPAVGQPGAHVAPTAVDHADPLALDQLAGVAPGIRLPPLAGLADARAWRIGKTAGIDSDSQGIARAAQEGHARTLPADGRRIRDGAAPAGWGWLAGVPMGDITADDLPTLPLLRILPSRQRNAAVVEALQALPFIRRVQARLLHEKYGLEKPAAWDLLQRAQGKNYVHPSKRESLP